MIRRNRIIGCVASLALLMSAGLVFGGDVLPGLDLWTTPPGGAFEDFAGNPIPADFFAPGSDPFSGTVNFVGQPSPFFPPADTAVQRIFTAILPAIPSSDTIPIVLEELSLVSIAPITVTFNGGMTPEDWDVEVGLSSFQPQPTGQMTINHTTDEGGTYDADLCVVPKFTFTEVGNPGNIRVLDFGQEGIPCQPIAVAGQPWCHEAVLPLVNPNSGPNFFVKGQTNHSGPHPEADPIETAIVPAIPTVSEWGLIVLTILLLTAGTIVFRRSRLAMAAA